MTKRITNQIFFISILGILLLFSCEKSTIIDPITENEIIEKSDPVEGNIEIVPTTSASSSSITSLYENLITPSNYNHFYQFNSSNKGSSCGLATSYMIGKGLFGYSVNNQTLQSIITGMKTDDLGASGQNAYNYAKSDLGTSCSEYITLKNKEQAFNKIYQTIKDGFPLIALINMKKNNGAYELVSSGSHVRHWVLVVGVRVESFTNNNGEIIFIDPLSKTSQIKYALSDDFLSSSISTSTANPKTVNMLKIGCANNSISSNYLGTGATTSGQIPADNSNGINIPISLRWSSIGTGAMYRIQISKSTNGWSAMNGFPNNNNRVVNTNTSTNNNYTYSSNSADLTEAPLNNTTYYWTIKSYLNGISSKYTAPIKFTTAPAGLVAPTALPATNVTSTSFTCNWTGDNPITSGYYSLIVATDPNFNNVLPNFPQNVTSNLLNLNSLNPNKWYYYKVQTVTGSGNSSWSNVISIKTN